MLVSSEVSFGPGILQTFANVSSENWKTGFLPHVSKNRNSFNFFPNKQWVYKHTQPEIMDFLSISLSIFPASDLLMGKVLSRNLVYFLSGIEPNYDLFLEFFPGLLLIPKELYKNGNLQIVCFHQYQNH